MLALAFLVVIGVVLIAEGFEVLHVPKGYIYFSMAFPLTASSRSTSGRASARRRRRAGIRHPPIDERLDILNPENPMAKLILYHSPQSPPSAPDHLGRRPAQLAPRSTSAGRAARAAYLAVNPMGKVPAIVHDGAVVTEQGTVYAYAADLYPEGGHHAIGDPLRGPYLRWSSFEPAVVDRSMARARAAVDLALATSRHHPPDAARPAGGAPTSTTPTIDDGCGARHCAG